MALKIKSISGIEDIVVSFADSANNVPATGIYGLETSGNINAFVKDDKLILSGKDTDLSDYYDVDEINAFLDEKQDVLNFEYNNDAISAINGSALAIPEIDLSDYYTKTETSGKEELSTKFDTKQDIIANKKDSSIPYLETANSSPSWEVIESSQINAHGTAEEGEVYTVTINERQYTAVCLYGKLWLTENYVDEEKATVTDPEYGSYFTKAQMDRCVPEGWRLPTADDFQELIDKEPNHFEKYYATNWYTSETDSRYVACTNELKLNLQPGGYYRVAWGDIDSKTYIAYYGTSTKEKLSESSGLQRVYYRLDNCISSPTDKPIYKAHGSGNDGNYPYLVNVRLIKNDLDVSGPECWKKFNGKNFMAIADDEGNTFKDFYLKTSAAQQLYQPKGDYASSADVTVLNTYYGLTTTGWKDISTNYYDKQAVDNMIAGIGGDYVEHSEYSCVIGSANNVTPNIGVFVQGASNTATNTATLVQGSANNVLGYESFAQGWNNYIPWSTYGNFAQGRNNSANNGSLAQGDGNSARAYSFAQGYKNSAYNYSFAQGKECYATDNGASFAQGFYCSAVNYGVSIGDKNSAYNFALAMGINSRANTYSIAHGQTVSATNYSFSQGNNTSAYDNSIAQGGNASAENKSFAQGDTISAKYYSLAQGQNNSAYMESLAQGGSNTAYNYSLAQGYHNSARENSIAQGYENIATNNAQAFGNGIKISGGMAIGKYNKTSADVAFVIGNGGGDAAMHRRDLFLISSNGVASGADFITSAGKKLSDCITSLPTITEYVSGTGIVFTAGSGVNEGKTVIEVDSTNYKLLTTAEYAELTAAVAIISANSGRWVLTPAS